MEVAYIPVGVGTFDQTTAEKEFNESVKLLKKLHDNVKTPDQTLLDIDKLSSYLDTISPDLAIFQNTTFANA